MKDVAKQRAANGAKRKSARPARVKESDFMRLFESARDGILLIDAMTAEISFVNRAFLRMSGFSRDEMIGKRFWESRPFAELDVSRVVFTTLQNQDSIYYDELPLETKDGDRITIESLCSIHPVDGRKVIQCTIRDVSERRRVQEELWRAEAQFRLLFENNPLPMWIYDSDTLAFLQVNDAAIGVYGYSREEFMHMTIRDLHPAEDVPDFLKSARDVPSPYLKPDVWNHRKKNGETMDVEMTAHDIRFNGRSARFVVTTDVTTRSKAEDLMKETRRLLQDVLNTLPVGVWIIDDRGTIIMGNPASKRIWGEDRYVVVDPEGKHKCRWSKSGKRIEADEWAALRAVTRGETSLDEVIDIDCSGGSRKTILNSAVPMRDSLGNITGAIVVNQDITERTRQEEELKRVHALLERQATTDSLTGVHNRLKFDELLGREIQEAMRYGHPLSCIMLDIDLFKSINDTYGHLTGDVVLKELARVVSRNIRSVDIFARWGGEEFIVLSPNTAAKEAQQMAEKLRAQIEKNEFSCPCAVTCSFGLTQFQEKDTVDSLIKRVDFALYRAKERGRNRVETG